MPYSGLTTLKVTDYSNYISPNLLMILMSLVIIVPPTFLGLNYTCCYVLAFPPYEQTIET